MVCGARVVGLQGFHFCRGNPQMVQLLVEREKQEDEEMENEASPCLSKFARCFYRPLCDWKLLEMDSSKYVTSTF